jgi:hypothetical protein
MTPTGKFNQPTSDRADPGIPEDPARNITAANHGWTEAVYSRMDARAQPSDTGYESALFRLAVYDRGRNQSAISRILPPR